MCEEKVLTLCREKFWHIVWFVQLVSNFLVTPVIKKNKLWFLYNKTKTRGFYKSEKCWQKSLKKEHVNMILFHTLNTVLKICNGVNPVQTDN